MILEAMGYGNSVDNWLDHAAFLLCTYCGTIIDWTERLNALFSVTELTPSPGLKMAEVNILFPMAANSFPKSELSPMKMFLSSIMLDTKSEGYFHLSWTMQVIFQMPGRFLEGYLVKFLSLIL